MDVRDSKAQEEGPENAQALLIFSIARISFVVPPVPEIGDGIRPNTPGVECVRYRFNHSS